MKISPRTAVCVGFCLAFAQASHACYMNLQNPGLSDHACLNAQSTASNAAAMAAADRAIRAQEQRRAEMNAERAADYWGGVVINLNNGDWYSAANYPLPTSAVAQLEGACTHPACAVVAVYKNTCVAQALGDKGEIFWAEDARPATAQQKAKKLCEGAAHACDVAEKYISCSGFNYTDRTTGEVGTGQKSFLSLWRQYRHAGSLLGILAPRLMGVSEVGKGEVLFNPVVVQLSQQPRAVKETIDVPAFLAPLRGKRQAPDIYIATALSKNGRAASTYFGVTPAVAENEAMTRCGKSDCYVLLTFKNGLCAAQSWGRDRQGANYDHMVAAPTEAQAKKLALDQCVQSTGQACQIAQSFCSPAAKEGPAP